MGRVVEALGDGREDLEPDRLPEADRSRVGLDDGVELHAAIAVGSGQLEHPLAERPADATTAGRRVDHEARGGDVRGGSLVVGSGHGGAEYGAVVDGDDRVAGWVGVPPLTARRLAQVAIPREGLAGLDDPS